MGNKAVGLDDMLCEQIKYPGPKAMVWVKEMMNNILQSDCYSESGQRLLSIKELYTNLIAVSHVQVA